MISIDENQCVRLGELIKGRIDLSPLKQETNNKLSNQNYELLQYYLTAICHATKGNFSGIVNSKPTKGWDYLNACFQRALEKDQTILTKIDTLTLEELTKILTDDLGSIPKDNLTARLEILKKCAQDLKAKGGFPFKEKEATVNEAKTFLSSLNAYDDPLGKKANLLIHTLSSEGIWKIADPQNIPACIDYHIMRGALRTGIVIPSKELHERLINKEEITITEDTQVRKAVLNAITKVGIAANASSIAIGNFFWMHFRTDCRADIAPNCNKCKNKLSNRGEGTCSLAPICKAYTNENLRKVTETTVNTIWY